MAWPKVFLFGTELKLFCSLLCFVQGSTPLEISYECRKAPILADYGAPTLYKLLLHR